LRSDRRTAIVGWATFLVFLALCFLGGGASRGDVLSLLYLRPAAILVIAAFLLLPVDRDWRTYRGLLLMLAAFAGLMVIQLVPLPPAVWTQLPGRAPFEYAAEAAGLAQPWRPITLSPERTLQSLLCLMFPFATLLALATIGRERGRALVPVLIGAVLLSAVLGILQLTAGERSPFHFYEITHRGSAVGVFANRNHQAALLAICIPMLRVWTLFPAEARESRTRRWIALSLTVFLVAMILVTGSRAGLALGLVGLIAAYLIEPVGIPGRRGSPLVKLALVALPLLTAAAIFALGRATAIQRLIQDDAIESDARFQLMPIMLRIIPDYLPFGAGFGTFDPVFRLAEPDRVLDMQFLNHAHNEIVELAITGGVPALALLAVFLVWYVRASFLLFRRRSPDTPSTLFGRLGATIVLVLLLASIVDYPLRTPLLAVVFTIGCSWIAQARRSQIRRQDVDLANV
jgi:O-antigen ligase